MAKTNTRGTVHVVDCSPNVGVNHEAVAAARKASVDRLLAGDTDGALAEAARAKELAARPARVTVRDMTDDEQAALEQLRKDAIGDAARRWKVQRDALLSACDWTVLPDSPLSTQKQTVWRKYRQALRDLPPGGEWPKLPAG